MFKKHIRTIENVSNKTIKKAGLTLLMCLKENL